MNTNDRIPATALHDLVFEQRANIKEAFPDIDSDLSILGEIRSRIVDSILPSEKLTNNKLERRMLIEIDKKFPGMTLKESLKWYTIIMVNSAMESAMKSNPLLAILSALK